MKQKRLEVMQPESFADYDAAQPQENPEAPDLILTTGPGLAFKDETTGPILRDALGTKGMHGHDPMAEYMQATFVAAGAGIGAGKEIGIIDAVDVAPPLPTCGASKCKLRAQSSKRRCRTEPKISLAGCTILC